MVIVRHEGGGWFRLWSNGPGFVWKPRNAPLIFSERYGHERTFVVGPWRIKVLRSLA